MSERVAGELLGAVEQCGQRGFVEAFEDEDLVRERRAPLSSKLGFSVVAYLRGH